mmetsp:Transcript_1380/g.3015  ORF Transcript_1380/g.3015 Transcript_1380/m.3015 type:complete len:256 (-) Transcript_1380:1570-2337(-)
MMSPTTRMKARGFTVRPLVRMYVMKKVQTMGIAVPSTLMAEVGSSTHCLTWLKKEPAITLPKNTITTWKMKKRERMPKSTLLSDTVPDLISIMRRMRGTSARKILRARPGTMDSRSLLMTALPTNTPRPGILASLDTSIRPWTAATGIMKKNTMSQNSTHMETEALVRTGAGMPRFCHSSSSGSGAGCVTQVVVSWWWREVEATAWSRRVLNVTKAEGHTSSRASACCNSISPRSQRRRATQCCSPSTFLISPPP